ncbi:class I SAM-dependent methyltransferase [Mycolicibacterium flavescens]|uniref:SAM-dependent methyltransferase n=1 Tax=Mycolicibacterium flavescens TaxID=1776 RepID=A0A1E3RPE7_MYCFV|nr:class I SAM-dependent methyltransferase [Mycolicibacterium flavescens]MCV7281186.1 class I SAM-dependent methyltransferase [Mycolicibacterium flavescens]ODQ91282.1 SAM-dependent methyltransferase [Mycolicibacterium flavescens]
MTPDYWNHNTAYHPWLLDIAARHRGDVLDVGCGDGLLAHRLASVSRSVTAIDPDPAAIRRAGSRLADRRDVMTLHTGFDAFDPGDRRFDLIIFVASLHHMDLRTSLIKARNMLRATGEIAVVGLSANRSVRDYLWALMCMPFVRAGSWWHRETPDIGVEVSEPQQSLAEIRRTVHTVLPGAMIRRALYYRYLLRWSPRSIDSSA